MPSLALRLGQQAPRQDERRSSPGERIWYRVFCSGTFLGVLLLCSLPADWMVPILAQPSCCERPRLRSALTVVWGLIPHRLPAPAGVGCRQPRGSGAITAVTPHQALSSTLVACLRAQWRAPVTDRHPHAWQTAHELRGLALRPQEAADLGMRMQGTAREMTAGVATVGRGRRPSPPFPLPSLSVDPERGGAWML